jgi:NADH dehydrogenase
MILVVGATGSLGGRIARGLLARGAAVRALVRAGRDATPLQQAGASIVTGDLADEVSLRAACEGVDTVVTTANSARRSGPDTVDRVDRSGTASLIDAARAAGVRRFVYTSVLGVSANSPVPFLAAKGENESRLRASGLEWTILAPNAFQEWWPARVVGAPAISGGPVTLVGEGRKRHTFVSEADVAAFAIAVVGHPAAANRHLPIGGPEALTWRDVVAVYERVLGRSLDVRFVAPGEPVPGVPPAVQPLLAALDTYETVIDTQPLASEFGVHLTALEDVARRQAAGVAGQGTGV